MKSKEWNKTGKSKDFIKQEAWDLVKLKDLISEEMVDHINLNISPTLGCLNDIPRWMPSTDGFFTTKLAYKLLRVREGSLRWIDYI